MCRFVDLSRPLTYGKVRLKPHLMLVHLTVCWYRARGSQLETAVAYQQIPEWPEFDIDNARWEIPAKRMKRDTPHIVPLSRQAVEVVKALKLITGSGKLVFPGDVDKKKSMSNNTILKALERMGYKGVMTGHGFRGLASTVLHEQGLKRSILKCSLPT